MLLIYIFLRQWKNMFRRDTDLRLKSFLFTLATLSLKSANERIPNSYVIPESKEKDQFLESLSYSLTNAQLRTVSEVAQDMSGETPVRPSDTGRCRLRKDSCCNNCTYQYGYCRISGSIDGTNRGSCKTAL